MGTQSGEQEDGGQLGEADARVTTKSGGAQSGTHVVHHRAADSGHYVRLGVPCSCSQCVPQAPAPSVCDECGMRVKNLERHKRKVHAVVEQSSGSGGGEEAAGPAKASPSFALTRCPVCKSMVADLEKHVRKAKHDPNWAAALKVRPALLKVLVHKRPEGYACPFCSAALPTATQLKSHVVGTHGGKSTLDILQFR